MQSILLTILSGLLGIIVGAVVTVFSALFVSYLDRNHTETVDHWFNEIPRRIFRGFKRVIEFLTAQPMVINHEEADPESQETEIREAESSLPSKQHKGHENPPDENSRADNKDRSVSVGQAIYGTTEISSIDYASYVTGLEEVEKSMRAFQEAEESIKTFQDTIEPYESLQKLSGIEFIDKKNSDGHHTSQKTRKL